MKSLLLAGLVTATLASCGDNKTTADYLKSSADLMAKKQANTAIIELKNAISQAPQDAQLRLALGKIYLEIGDLVSAEKELGRSLSDAALLNDALPLLAKAYQLDGKAQKLAKLTSEYSSKVSDITKLKLAVYSSILFSQQGKKSQSEQSLQQAIAISEDNVYSQLADAWYKSANQDFDAALIIADQLVKTSPQLTDSLLLQAHLFAAKKEYAQAADSYHRYAEQHPQQYQIKMFEANSLMAAGELTKADVIAEQLLKRFPKHPFVNQLKAQISYSEGKYQAAKDYANVALQSTDSLMAKLIQGLSAYQLKEYEQAYQSLRTVVSSLPSDNPVQKLFASLQLQLGYQNEALRSFEQLKNLNAKDVNMLQNASMAFARSGNNKEADKLIDKALEISPDKAELVMQKGMLKLKEQDQTGMALLEKALKLDPELKVANITLATQYITKGEFDKALDIAKQWQATKSGKIQGLLLEGVIYSQQNKLPLAIDKFKDVLQQDTKNVAAIYYLGLLALQDKDTEAATKYFETVLTINPQHVGAIKNLIQVNLANENKDELTQFFTKLQLKYPDNLSVIYAQAANYSAQGKQQAAIDLLLKYKDSPAVTDDYWFMLADVYQQDKQPIKAQTIYQNLINKEPKNAKPRLSLMALLAKASNYDGVVLEADKAIAAQPNNAQYLLVKARFLLKQNKLTQAGPIIDQLSNQFPNSINVMRLNAVLATQNKDYSKAASILAQVYQINNTAEHLIDYAQALKANKQTDKAITLLQQYLTRSPDVGLVKVILAQYQISSAPEKALANYYQLLEKSPKNIVLLNNIAWGELQLKHLDKAEHYAQQAYQVAPKLPQVLDTYGLVLLAKGDHAKALTFLEKAYDGAKHDHDITLHYAQALAKNGQQAQLKALIDVVGKNNPTLKQQLEGLE